MKKIFLPVLVLAFLMLVSQCSKDETTADEDAIRNLVMADSTWFGTSTTVDSVSGSSGRDTTVVWWRGVQTHNQPTIEIDIVGDSAWVSWQRGNYGYLYSLALCDTPPWVLWTKKLSETAQVRATFLRTGATSESDRGWQLHSISLATGKSDSLNTVRIDSLRINASNYPDLVITNPLNRYYRLDSLLTFLPADSITLTLYTNVENGEAFLHTFILAWPFYIRLKFDNLGNGIYQGIWPAQLVALPRFAIFDLLSHETLYAPDDQYDFNGWLLPYTISP